MKCDVKSAIADILKQEKIEYIFGYTGGHIQAMWKAADDAKIRLILNRQEGNAAYMADAYARLSKKPSVILTTSGPGATNIVTGIANAYMDAVPMVAICAGVGTHVVGKNAVQEGSGRGRTPDQRLVFSACSKQAILAPSPEAVPDMIREAFKVAMSGRRGPVYVEVPSNFWNVEIDYERISSEKYKNTDIPKCDKHKSLEVANHLYKSKHPLIIIGEGAEENSIKEKLNKFLNQVQIPFGVSPIAKNYVDEYHPLYLGVQRLRGKTQKIYEYMKKSDFILYLGDRLQQWEVNQSEKALVEKAKLAQIDPDDTEIGRVFTVDYSVLGSITSFIDNIPAKKHDQSLKLKSEVEKLRKKMPREKRYKDGDGINPYNLNNITEELADDNTTIVCDTGYAKHMAIIKFRTKLSQNFITADKNGPTGYSVPAALGAALQTKGEVICFVGDGGYQMSCNELGTAMEYGLKVIFIIENNGGCQTIADSNKRNFGCQCADIFHNPDFVRMAESYNLKGYKAETSEEFEEVFKNAKKDKISVVIEAKIDQGLMIWE